MNVAPLASLSHLLARKSSLNLPHLPRLPGMALLARGARSDPDTCLPQTAPSLRQTLWLGPGPHHRTWGKWGKWGKWDKWASGGKPRKWCSTAYIGQVGQTGQVAHVVVRFQTEASGASGASGQVTENS